ncbi:MAG: CvpA family protein, partial [Candidatus Omnitrophica bacterium]|nr:CvpA family protein [Candidatus Omnitrophota bacterium]
YVGVQAGVVIELFKTLGALVTVFVAFHYYTALTGLLLSKVAAPAPVGILIVFVALWVVLFLLCKFIRDGIMMVFTIQAQAAVDKWGGAVLAVGRFFIVASMLMFAFLLTGKGYLSHMASVSFSNKYVTNVAPNIYRGMCEGVITKLFPKEKVNTAVRDVLEKPGK